MYLDVYKWKCTIKFTLNDASDIDDVLRLQHKKVYKPKLQKLVTKLIVNNGREENWIYCKRSFWYRTLWIDKPNYFSTTSRNCFCCPTPLIARSESRNPECTRASTNENPQSNSHWMMLLKLMMFEGYSTRWFTNRSFRNLSLNWRSIKCVKKIEFIAKNASDIENCGWINKFIFRQPLEIVFVFQLQ